MKFTTIILSILFMTLGGCKSHKSIRIIDANYKTEYLPFVNVYSYANDSCIGQSDLDGIFTATVNPKDTLQFEMTGFEILKFAAKDLNAHDSIFMRERSSGITLGSANIKSSFSTPKYKCRNQQDKLVHEPKRVDLKQQLGADHKLQQQHVAEFIDHINTACLSIKSDPVIVQLEIDNYGHLTHFAFPDKQHDNAAYQEKVDCITRSLNESNPEFGGLKSAQQDQNQKSSHYSIIIE